MLRVLRMGIAVLGVAMVTIGAIQPAEAACQLIKATASAGLQGRRRQEFASADFAECFRVEACQAVEPTLPFTHIG